MNTETTTQDTLKEYLLREWRHNCAPKYQRYFEEWYRNLTAWQLTCYTAWMLGSLSPWVEPKDNQE